MWRGKEKRKGEEGGSGHDIYIYILIVIYDICQPCTKLKCAFLV